jgi:poly(A) polymerase
MSANDPKRQFALEVVERLQEAGFEAYWAGGCVRDFLVGRTPKDYDVATNARPEKVRDVFGKRYTVPVGVSFGVILVRGTKQAGDVEVATFRSEGPYADGRRPDHVSYTTAEYDAQRRDFTINGMFYDPVEQRVIDYVGGERDLSDGVIRAIGDPHDRMREDKLRMLRAVRFAATMNFALDETTANAVREMAEQIHVVSAERISAELKRMLIDQHRRRAIELCATLGLLQLIVPELREVIEGEGTDGMWERTLKMLQLLQEPRFELAMAVLLNSVQSADRKSADEVVLEICKRLRLSNDEAGDIVWLLAHRYDLEYSSTLSAAQLKRRLAAPLIGDLIASSRAEILASNGDLSPVIFCEEYLRNTPREEIDPKPLLTGNDLIALGFIPNPAFKDILDTVRDAQLNGEISTREEARILARRLQGKPSK